MMTSLEEANNYFSSRLFGGTWFTSSNRDQALLEAEKRIALLDLKGEPLGDDPFPRKYFRREGTFFEEEEVPEDIKEAVYELAFTLLTKKPEDPRIIRESFLGASIQYNPDYSPTHVIAGIPSERAWKILAKYINNHKTIRIERV